MNLALYDSSGYRKYTTYSELDKALHMLEGILKGVAIDDIINKAEIEELYNWCNFYRTYSYMHPFKELIPLIEQSINDDVLTNEEVQDILWLCNNYKSNSKYYDIVTSDIQRLQGLLHGILADNTITTEEVLGLQDWMNDNDHLLGVYPYDEVQSLITVVLQDGKVDDHEKDFLKVYFSEFIDLRNSYNLNQNEIEELKKDVKISGICSVCPEVVIEENLFCFTGASSKSSRSKIQEIVEGLGGRFQDSVTLQTKYLVVGNEGNQCWAFSCYGRKVEKAIALRKSGKQILIIHENDFWDAVEDLR